MTNKGCITAVDMKDASINGKCGILASWKGTQELSHRRRCQCTLIGGQDFAPHTSAK